MKEEVLKQICKMIASGEIPKEVYDKYLSKCPIGFMTEEELFRYLTQLEFNWKELMEDIPHILEVIEYNKDVIKVTSDEELAIYSLQNKMQELEQLQKCDETTKN